MCFNQIILQVKTKTVKEVIEYYYFWKKTQHYKQWKNQYIPDPRTDPHLVAVGDVAQTNGVQSPDVIKSP